MRKREWASPAKVAMSKSRKNPSASWELAARLCERSVSGLGKAEIALDQYVTSLSSRERAHCQRLFYAYVRHARLIDTTLEKWVARTPRPQLAGILRAALGDALESTPEKRPQVADFWVGKTREALSGGEAGLVNAVQRRAAEFWNSSEVMEDASLRYSHPGWLAERWASSLGTEKAQRLMAWNQQPAEVFLRLRGLWEELPANCEATDWPGFIRWNGKGNWAEIQEYLKTGRLYAQDPGTRLAPALLRVQPGESVLDLCAAPGGKSLILADALGEDPEGLLVCVEQPGPRIDQLDENLRKLSGDEGPEVQLLAADVRDLSAEDIGQFDAVLLDAPCSNSGVIRRRPDVKWRLQPESVAEMAKLQGELLSHAAGLVRPGGRLVYSTCSIEAEENEGVVQIFLEGYSDFKLVSGKTHVPVETGHDGAGTFFFQKS